MDYTQYLIVRSIRTFFQIIYWLIFIRIILSWIGPQNNRTFRQISQMIFAFTEPLLQPIRRLLPMEGMGLDFSPLVLLLVLHFVERFLTSLL